MNRFVSVRSGRGLARAVSFGVVGAAALAASSASAQTVIFEKFNQAGNDWTATQMSQLILPSAASAVERVVIPAGLGAPNTSPALPINEGGDKEGRFFESGGVFGASYALTPPGSGTNITDGSIDGYVAFGVTDLTGTRSAGMLLRATEALGNVTGYIAILNHSSNNTGTLSISVVRNGVIQGPDVLVTSESFPMTPGVENYHLHFTANGGELIARLNRVEVIAGSVVESRIDLRPEAGVQDSIIAVHHEFLSGRAGVRAFTRSTNSVFFDEVDIVERGCDNHVSMESQTLGASWGNLAGTVPGDIIFTEENIPVRLFDFEFAGGGGTFGNATIQRTVEQVGFGRIMRVNNVNVGFNFSQIGRAGRVTIEFGDQGGFENLVVNNSPTYIGELSMVPSNFAPGITARVDTTSIGGGTRGVLTLTGNIFNVRIGGQEFYIDDVCAAVSCPCDWNANFVLNSQDFFDFLSDFFGAGADYNMDGLTNSQDYFDFLTCFLTACE